MAIQLSTNLPFKKEYHDDANWNFSASVKTAVQPVNRKVDGKAFTQHVVVREYAVRDVVCAKRSTCSNDTIETPITIRMRVSGPVGDDALNAVFAQFRKLLDESGDVRLPAIAQANF